MPPSAGACQTTLASLRPDWGRAADWSSIITAMTGRRATASVTGRPVRGAGTIRGVGFALGVGSGVGVGDGVGSGVGVGVAVGWGEGVESTEADGVAMAMAEGEPASGPFARPPAITPTATPAISVTAASVAAIRRVIGCSCSAVMDHALVPPPQPPGMGLAGEPRGRPVRPENNPP